MNYSDWVLSTLPCILTLLTVRQHICKNHLFEFHYLNLISQSVFSLLVRMLDFFFSAALVLDLYACFILTNES